MDNNDVKLPIWVYALLVVFALFVYRDNIDKLISNHQRLKDIEKQQEELKEGYTAANKAEEMANKLNDADYNISIDEDLNNVDNNMENIKEIMEELNGDK